MIHEMNKISYMQPKEQGEYIDDLQKRGVLSQYPIVGIDEWLAVNTESPIDQTLCLARDIGKASYFESKPMSDDDRALIVQFMKAIKGDDKAQEFGQNQCYFNAQMTLLQAYPLLQGDPWLKRLKYCEGYVQIPNSLYPFSHAWCMFDSHLVDPTLLHPQRSDGTRRSDFSDRIYGDIPEGWKYFGMVFNASAVYKMVKKNNCWYAPFLDYSRSNFNMLEALKNLKTKSPKP
jgi:hypothetical protein